MGPSSRARAACALLVEAVLLASFALASAGCRGDRPRAVADRLEVVADGVVSVPLVPYRLPLVSVAVPGGEALFCADTGATHTLFDAGFVEAAGLRTGRWDSALRLGVREGRAGSTDRWADVPWMELGALRTGRFTAIVGDLAHVVPDPPGGARFGGVLGIDVLLNFAPYYDGPAGMLHLLPRGDVAGALRGLVDAGTPFQQSELTFEPRPHLQLGVGEGEGELVFPLLLDTGAARTHLPGAAIALLQLDGAGESSVLDVAGAQPLRLHDLPALHLGGIVARGLQVGECSLQDALLGFDVLSEVPFVVDEAGGLLWMRVPPSPRSPGPDPR